MIYLTYADQPSGVFASQVIDVCKYINQSLNANIRLVAFISIRDFKKNKNLLIKEMPSAIVLPMLPKASYWKFNGIIFGILSFFINSKTVIARNVMAGNIALKAKKFGRVKKVCFDGRGAIAAEWREYEVVQYESWKRDISELEKKIVLQSDYRIAVSSKLVDYWKEDYGYNGNSQIIIPCTLNSGFSAKLLNKDEVQRLRKESGYDDDDMILVYSGSTAGWQSFSMLEEILIPVLSGSKKNKILFLSGNDENIEKLKKQFPGQVSNKWVAHKDVLNVLSICDYGVLIREQSVTNKVASPTKFAEYLSAGLAVLISENIGDYSDFVVQHQCGHIVKKNETLSLKPVPMDEKQRFLELVKNYFTKDANCSNYQQLIEKIS